MDLLTTVPLLIIDDLGMRKLPLTAAEELLEIIMRRYERASTLLTSNRPVDDWGKLLGDSAAVTAMLDRLLHQATFSSAARAVGAPQPAVREMRNESQSGKDAGQRTPGGVATRDPEAPTTKPHHRNAGEERQFHFKVHRCADCQVPQNLAGATKVTSEAPSSYVSELAENTHSIFSEESKGSEAANGYPVLRDVGAIAERHTCVSSFLIRINARSPERARRGCAFRLTFTYVDGRF